MSHCWVDDDFAYVCSSESREEIEEAEGQQLQGPLSDPRGDAYRLKLQQNYYNRLQTELLEEYRRVFQMRLDKKFKGEEVLRVQEVLQDAEVLLRSPGDKGKDNRHKKVVLALKSFKDSSFTYKSLFLPIEIVLALPIEYLLVLTNPLTHSKK